MGVDFGVMKSVKRVFARFWRITHAMTRKESLHSACTYEFLYLDAETRINCNT